MSRLINDVTAIRMLLGVGILNFGQHARLLRLRPRHHADLDRRVLTLASLLPFPVLLLRW